MATKLATKHQGWLDKSGSIHKTQKSAVAATAFIQLTDLMRRLERSMPSQSSNLNTLNSSNKSQRTPFLATAAWFKENSELVRMLTNYKLDELEAKEVNYKQPSVVAEAESIADNRMADVRQSVDQQYGGVSIKQYGIALDGTMSRLSSQGYATRYAHRVTDAHTRNSFAKYFFDCGYIPQNTTEGELVDYLTERQKIHGLVGERNETIKEYFDRIGRRLNASVEDEPVTKISDLEAVAKIANS